MNEIRVLFAGKGDALTCQLVHSQGGAGPPVPFVPFLSEGDYDDLHWYLEKPERARHGGLPRPSRPDPPPPR